MCTQFLVHELHNEYFWFLGRIYWKFKIVIFLSKKGKDT